MQIRSEKIKLFWKNNVVPMLKILWNLIIILALYWVFLKLFIYIFPLSVLAIIGKYTYKKKWSDSLPILVKSLYETIYNFDRYCNREFRTFWNLIFIGSEGYKFGNVLETLSSALGKNQRDHPKSLTIVGWVIIYILWAIDWSKWKKGGHCIASINEQIN